MGKVFDALQQITSVQDTEVLESFRRYDAELEKVLTPEEMALYADYLQQVGVVRIFDEMEKDEITTLPTAMRPVAARVVTNTDLTMENRRVVALLDQHGEHAATPDYQRN